MKTASYKLLGFLSLALGIVGAFLPVLPTTCFILLSAWCFTKSSPKWHKRLLDNPVFGESLRHWETHRCIPAKARFIAIGSMLTGGGISLLFINSIVLQGILVLLIAIGIYSVQSIKQCQLTYQDQQSS
jgi:uncharacterized membrane protein YbaN (DUF454 family)